MESNLIKKWQERLHLTDWELDLSPDPPPDEGAEGQTVLRAPAYTTCKQATIHLAPNIFDVEEVVAHEMTHLLEIEGGLYDYMEDEVNNALSRLGDAGAEVFNTLRALQEKFIGRVGLELYRAYQAPAVGECVKNLNTGTMTIPPYSFPSTLIWEGGHIRDASKGDV